VGWDAGKGRRFMKNKLTGAEKQKQLKYLMKLREGALDNDDPIGYLTSLACEYGDQPVQKAAITGLSKYANKPKALLGIAMRLLDSWGCGTINHVIGILSKLADQGGLIPLSSTLFYDNRFIYDKVMAIKKVLQKGGDEQDLLKMEELEKVGNYFVELGSVNEWMKIIVEMKNPDISEGAIFGSQYEGLFGGQGNVLRKWPPDELSRAIDFVNTRIPGLEDLYNKKMRKKVDTL
jgi:hypothetical protein